MTFRRAAAFAMLALAIPAVPAVAKQGAALEEVLKAPRRDADRARDQYRHPAETLAFFQVADDMTVVEYAPGGGWYTRILAPMLAAKGHYIALNFGSAGTPFPADAQARLDAFPAEFPQKVEQWTGLKDSTAYSSTAIPEAANGTVDRILVIRMMHNLMRWNIADREIKAMRALLKKDGLVGIVQHRARPDAPYTYTDGSKGYLREADVIAFMTINGFDLVEKSEINANPRDTANWPEGVWTLPPAERGEKEKAAEHQAIGESDRMTLLFRKRA